MLQEDSNGEASFEIIDKKNNDNLSTDKTESISSVSSNYSIPSPSVANIPTSGNLLSNLPPPSALPDFTLWQAQQTTTSQPTIAAPIVANLVPPVPATTATTTTQVLNPNAPNIQPFMPTQFSAAIPPSKGIQHGPTISSATDTNQNSGGLINWMKDAVGSGGILQKVAEKAKNSIDSVITTLDPQMTEFIHTGGDVVVIIASEDVDEIVPIRDAVYAVFGKARVNNLSIKVQQEKHQAFGFDEGLKRLEDKISGALNQQKLPTIAIESILLHQNEEWFSMYMLMLNDAEKQIKIHTYSQAIPLPVNKYLLQAKTEMPEFAKTCESPEKLLTAYFQSCKNDWQQTVSGVPKKDILHLAAKVLINVYKTKLLPDY